MELTMGFWYLLPMSITAIVMSSGIGIIIWSTSRLIVSLDNEIGSQSVEDGKDNYVIACKLKQFKLLNRTIVFLYLSFSFFIISGLGSELFYKSELSTFSLYIALMGSFTALIGLSILIVYSIRDVKLKQNQFNYKLTNQKKM